MKKIYWRPRAVSRSALMLIAFISLAGLLIVERYKVTSPQPYAEEKLAAANLAQKAFQVIKAARIETGTKIDRLFDPSESGLIGLPMSPATSVLGDVAAKQTSVNPNFAAVIVDMLKEAGVEEGDAVAIGLSGSFPALNICTYAACESLRLKPIVISSAAASQWGANVPALLWPDMERHLRRRVPVLNDEGEPVMDAAGKPVMSEHRLMSIKSIACSIGGIQDRGIGMNEEGLRLLQASIQRNGLTPFRGDVPPVSEEGDVAAQVQADFTNNVDERMKLYREAAAGQPIRAYINVGGGSVSVGREVGKLMFKPGLNTRPPRHVREIDGVMPRFINAGVPIIHVVHVKTLADRYTLPLEPITAPVPGEGGVFTGIDYSKPLVIGVLAFILLSLNSFIRSDLGFRILRASQRSRKSDAQPEPMV
ncbi:MAG TPA: poly-gamma-glutamate system protein [Lacipirellulaceae bacterium]|nr:poly-gamma-glutamate system protein [Lacipirellulaceae bacterium]